MGFISNLFGGPPDSAQELGDIARRAAQRAQGSKRRGFFRTLFGRSDPKFNQELGAKVRSDQRTQYYEHERQMREEERVHRSMTRPRYVYELEQSYRVPYYKQEAERLKAENSPYAAQMEEQLKYAQRSVDQHMQAFDHQHERQQYQQKYAFKQQQSDYASQTYEQANAQKEQMAEQMRRRQVMQEALHTQSNIGRGGKGGQPLGRGQKFSRFGPPQARGTFGRPSATRPGR